MSRAAGLLLEATERDANDGENRLTEILAAVLQGSTALTTALMERVGLPSGARYEVNTQVYAGGKFVDMEVLSLDGNGRVLGRLWAEHKVYAQLGPGQMQNYLELLEGRVAEHRRLVGIVRSEDLAGHKLVAAADDQSVADLRPHPEAEAATPRGAEWLTWQDIALLASRVGRRIGGRRWRDAALDESAPAALLLLEELVSALERRELAFMEALDTIHVTVVAAVEEARDTIEALWQRALQHLEGTPYRTAEGSESGRSHRAVVSLWQHLGSPTCWATQRYEAWAELVARTTDDWRPEEMMMDVPALGVGFSFYPDRAMELVDGQLLSGWRDELARQGLTVANDDGWIRCYGTLYLTQIVTAGFTLDDQAKAVAEWVQHTLQAIASSEPVTA